MKNILSYIPGTRIKGKVIKEWIKYNMDNESSHFPEAKKMVKYLNIDDNKYYTISKGNYQASSRSFQVFNVKEV